MSSRPPDLLGRRAVVTGANSGIGYETALAFARAGAAVTLACRDGERAEKAAARIRSSVHGAQVAVELLDLSRQDSVRALAQRWDGPLDILVNNAGVMAAPQWTETVDGFELQMGTNHLGHFALTGLLLPALLAAPVARVVTVSSLAHRRGRINLDDPQFIVGYEAHRAYANSKLANLSFALELQRRAGTGLVSAAAHPGLAVTGLISDREGVGSTLVGRVGGPVLNLVTSQSARAGALPSLYAATVAEPGSYTGPRRLFETRGAPAPAHISARAADPTFGRALFDLSSELTGVDFAF